MLRKLILAAAVGFIGKRIYDSSSMERARADLKSRKGKSGNDVRVATPTPSSSSANPVPTS